MSAVTVEVSDNLAARLHQHETQLPQILERGLRQVEAGGQPGYVDATDVFECLARQPEPQEILAMRASPLLQRRVEQLIQRKKDGQASVDEPGELEHYLFMDRLVRLAKAHAQRRLSGP